jgi:hypothetical protein
METAKKVEDWPAMAKVLFSYIILKFFDSFSLVIDLHKLLRSYVL